jgi:hypothetical protein
VSKASGLSVFAGRNSTVKPYLHQPSQAMANSTAQGEAPAELAQTNSNDRKTQTELRIVDWEAR